MQRGDMFTVTPHRLPHGPKCGTWHCRVTGTEHHGMVSVQEMKLDGATWRPSMSTVVYVAALRPLAVQVDLFGNPTPPASPRRTTRRALAGSGVSR